MKGNLYSILGPSALRWPFPFKTTTAGLRFKVAEGEGKWIDFHHPQYAELDEHRHRDYDAERDLEA